jgi:predicted GIY-YIG superfamily endonuclease
LIPFLKSNKIEDKLKDLKGTNLIADLDILALPKVALQVKQILPEYSGIYYVLDETNNIWYIGKAKNLRKRWQGKAHHRIYQLEAQKKQHFAIYYEQISKFQLDSLEKQRIEKYHPHLNASPVKTKNVHPTETLLRETIIAISDFAFILGVEPPRKEMQFQTGIDWLLQKKLLRLNIIHIGLNFATLNKKFNSESEEYEALIKASFITRKAYAQKWEKFPRFCYFMYRLFVNGYVVEVNSLNSFLPKEILSSFEYSQTTLASESIKFITPESLAKIQNQLDQEKKYAVHLKRLSPYTSDLIQLFFNEPINCQSTKNKLVKVSQDYKIGKRGIGSRSQTVDIDSLLVSREISTSKYLTKEIQSLSQDRMGVYVQCFSVDLKTFPHYGTIAQGIIDNQEIKQLSNQFEIVYFLTGVDKKAWLLVEEYLKDFAKPATKLNNGEGYVKKFYISPRKYIVPAKVNIKLEKIGYSTWIPFGFTEEFPTFETAKEEILRRLKTSNLPGLKITFKRETIAK